MATRFLLIAGAGCSLSDASKASMKDRPPLDRGFFAVASKLKHSEFFVVKNYLEKTYAFDPVSVDRDSLEQVMAIIYADIHNPQLEKDAVPAFRALIRLFNRRIAETTNDLKATNRSHLFKMLYQMLKHGYSPNDITIITFNQDIQIEKALAAIQTAGGCQKWGRVFNFPYFYELPDVSSRLSSPTEANVDQFEKGNAGESMIRVLKLHGSLNWYSIHHSKEVPKKAILNGARRYNITPRAHIATELTYSGSKRKEYCFPLVVPPVTHKAGILHQDFLPLWEKAEKALSEAEKIVVFGYSSPPTDFETANLLRRTVGRNRRLKEFHLIDPNAQVFHRYVDLTQLHGIHWFKDAPSYLRHAEFHMS